MMRAKILNPYFPPFYISSLMRRKLQTKCDFQMIWPFLLKQPGFLSPNQESNEQVLCNTQDGPRGPRCTIWTGTSQFNNQSKLNRMCTILVHFLIWLRIPTNVNISIDNRVGATLLEKNLCYDVSLELFCASFFSPSVCQREPLCQI